jgi:hypothetical protein
MVNDDVDGKLLLTKKSQKSGYELTVIGRNSKTSLNQLAISSN